MIEYEDLVEQLTKFRLEVVRALAAIDVEIDALHQAVVKQKPLLSEELSRIRAKSRQSLGKFVDFHAQKFPMLHEKR